MKRLLAFLLFASFAHAATVQLAWDASPTPNVLYRIKWGFASGPENQMHIVEAGPNLTVTIDEPWAPGNVIFFNVYAYNEAGESLPDGEVSWMVPMPTPEPTPIPSATPTPTPLPTATPMPTPEPPSNLRIILDALISWFRNLFPNI